MSRLTREEELEQELKIEREEHSVRRRGPSPLATVFLVGMAAIGFVVVGLAIAEGSFANGGQVADRGLAVANQDAKTFTHEAALATSDTLKNAGQTLKEKSGEAANATRNAAQTTGNALKSAGEKVDPNADKKKQPPQ